MDFMNMLEVIVRSVVSLAVLFILTKMLGKKQVSQLSAFDYVIGISMGSIAAEMTINKSVPFFDGVVAMTSYTIIAYLISFLTLKSIVLRRFFTGVPVVLISNGKIIKKNLRRSLIDINDLLEEARSSGYFNLDEVAYAVMETTGYISFLPKTENRPVTLKDMNLKDTVASLSAAVIIDGKVMEDNLRQIKKDEKWLIKQIKKQGYESPESIILATVDANYKMSIFKEIDVEEKKSVLE
ncbi:MAG TPA: DUF421 domain-containing protein [Mollicutes bacterium]|nr:DUF421 domain-containing protein [Mollicutes bacterium]